VDAARARNDSDAVRTFQSVAAKSGVEDDGTLGYAEHGERSEACQSFLCPFCCFPVKKDHWWWKTRETPVDSAFAPVEKAGKFGNFFVEIFNVVENRHANAHKSALFASAFSTRKRGG